MGDPAGHHHLARDLRVPGLVGIEERVRAEPGQEEEADAEREHDGARERTARHSGPAFSGWTLRGAR